MVYTIDFANPETIPPIIKMMKLDALAVISSKMKFYVSLEDDFYVVLDALDDFFSWLMSNEHYEKIKNKNWKVLINEEHKKIKFEFFTSNPNDTIAQGFGTQLALLLMEYTKDKMI